MTGNYLTNEGTASVTQQRESLPAGTSAKTQEPARTTPSMKSAAVPSGYSKLNPTVAPKKTAMTDIVYWEDGQLTFDAYLPDDGQSNPSVILVHGGGFENGDKSQDFYVKMGEEFSSRSYAAFNINYPLADLSKTPMEEVLATDIAAVLSALAYIKEHAAEYRVATDRFLLLGDSAGGAIVVNTALGNGKAVGIVGCVNLWGGINTASLDGTPWGGDLYPHAIDAERAVPFLILHGTADTVAGYAVSQRLSRKLADAGIDHRLIALEGAEHYPEQLANEIIRHVLEFFDGLQIR